MRKQTKLVAVLSAAALLAIGASMTSFAAGWQKDDDGTWHYYDSDDDMVNDEWKKDGAKWFYLDEDGNMLTDSWVDDDYYVGGDGAMLINQWVKTVSSDDVDDPDEDGDHWYYFDSKGKKVDDTHKRINGKTYYFNEDGEMQTGWYQDPDSSGANKVYYLGDDDDGARVDNSWLWLERPTDEDDEDNDDAWYDDEDCSLDCDDEGWYWFGSDGVMFHDNSKKKSVNGKYYYFNAHGQMLYEWVNTKAADADGSGGTGNAIDGRGEGDNIKNLASDSDAVAASQSIANQVTDGMRYAHQVEDGARANGWFEMEGPEDAVSDDDTDWYFIDDGEVKMADMSDLIVGAKDGTDRVYRAKIKCNGKYFAFDERGRMQDGLQYIDGSMYYFDADGYMKTGKIAAVEEEDDDNYAYYFKTKQGGNGKGENGEKDGYLYWNGKRMEADDDYKLVYVDDQLYLVNNKGKIQKSSSKNYDLEGLNEEDVQIKINKSTYAVQSVITEKGDLSKGGKVIFDYKDNSKSGDTYMKTLITEGTVDLPMIAIYDNTFAPGDVFKKGFSGRFYDNDLDEAKDIIEKLDKEAEAKNESDEEA